MCGIVLAINSKTERNYKMSGFLSDALLASQVRGTHATGLMQLDAQGVDAYKKALNATQFLDEPHVRGMIGYAGSIGFTVGHVRHATQGSKDNDANAHPFEITRADGSTLTGVHNGSLQNWRHKSKDAHEVDSHWALELIAEKGLEAFKEISGAFCFVWYDDAVDDTLYITRNTERPFHLVLDGKGAMYGASEAGMLEWLLERKDIMKVEDIVTLVLEPYKLYAINLLTLEITTEDVPKYVTPVATPLYNYNRSSYNNRGYNNYGYGSYDDSDYDDADPFGHFVGYHSSSVRSSRSVQHSRSLYTEANIKRISEALNPPPKKVEAKPMLLLEKDDIPFNVTEDDETEEMIIWGLASDVYKAQHVSTSTVTQKERDLALSMDCLGQFVCWEPVMYDDTLAVKELLGDVHYQQADGTRQKIQGTLRFIQKTRALNDFLNSGKDVFPMIVLGANTDNSGDVYLILGEMNAVDRKLMFENCALGLMV